MEAKTRVFLTGGTGVMGMAGLKELVRYRDSYEITVLARESARNRKKLRPFQALGVKVVWGDLLDRRSLQTAIENADIVLHVGGMVSPLADLYPDKTMKVNVGSIRLITDIVKKIEAQQTSRTVKVIYIGSVSQYGSKIPPHHWGNAGDAINPAKYDVYAESKVLAENILRDSGVRKWVSLRQTAILHPGLLKNINNPVVFHTPLGGVLEWITTEDSGRLLERVCRNGIPDDFWGKCYNVGGGKPFRLTNLEFERGLLESMGCPPPEKIFEPNWFAADNFHGMWFEDSDYLDDILHFREPDTFQQALDRMKRSLPFYYKLAPLAPPPLIKMWMKRVASRPGLGPLHWIKTNDEKRIKASWGSREEYDKIQGWNSVIDIKLDKEPPNKKKNS